MPANVKFAATRAVSLKALCNAVYVSATITLLGWLPLVLFLVHGPGMAWHAQTSSLTLGVPTSKSVYWGSCLRTRLHSYRSSRS